MGFLSTLTRTQAAAVERRWKSAYQTQRRRIRPHAPDVRDIFRSPEMVRRRCTQMTLSDHLNKYTLSNFGEDVQFTAPVSADSISINHPVSMQSTQEAPSTLTFE